MADSHLEQFTPGQRRIVVLGPAWLGDMVMAQCLFKALKQVPNTAVDVVAAAAYEPLLARMPEVTQCITVHFPSGRLSMSERFRLGRRLAEGNYDQAIILPNSWKSALSPFLARIPIRTGYVGEQRWGLINDIRRLDKHRLRQTAQRFAALAADDSLSTTDIQPVLPDLQSTCESQRTSAAKMDVSLDDRPVLLMCPGAQFGNAKRWPSEYFAQIAASKLNQNWQVWILGSAHDSDEAMKINAICNHRLVDLTGKTTLDQVIDLIALSTVVVSNDSGLMHVAAGLQKPLVAIFGSTDPGHTPPLNTNKRIEYLGLSCSPCFQRECPLGHTDCLIGIKPERVLGAIESVAGQ